MLRTVTLAALALTVSAPLAFAEDTKSISQQRLEEGTKRIQQELDAINYDVADESRPDDRDLVNALASPMTAEILLRKSVNNSQVEDVKANMDITIATDATDTTN